MALHVSTGRETVLRVTQIPMPRATVWTIIKIKLHGVSLSNDLAVVHFEHAIAAALRVKIYLQIIPRPHVFLRKSNKR
ncbi:hypothetical protein [Candidatus Phyllobacterium onerii]|uniref:hypothetical protein n=1 Tax=Candidatus Phyllobacterium onerii TaxID=3020828 RepID=UPI00232D7D4F|nr:hypothetical protein [Phyllobacterium sp. IY22]